VHPKRASFPHFQSWLWRRLTSEQGWPHQSKYACGVGHESSLGRINLSIQFHGSTFSVWIETNELHRKHKFITTGNLTHTPHQIPRTGWHLFFFQNTHKICVSISLRLGINNFTRKMLWSCSHQDQPKTAYSYYMIPGWSVRRNSERWLVRGKIPNRTGPARNATDVPGHAGATNRRLFTSRVYIAVPGQCSRNRESLTYRPTSKWRLIAYRTINRFYRSAIYRLNFF
jgi:hypothetical protein